METNPIPSNVFSNSVDAEATTLQRSNSASDYPSRFYDLPLEPFPVTALLLQPRHSVPVTFYEPDEYSHVPHKHFLPLSEPIPNDLEQSNEGGTDNLSESDEEQRLNVLKEKRKLLRQLKLPALQRFFQNCELFLILTSATRF